MSNGLGTQRSQCWDGLVTGWVDVFGENSGGIDFWALRSHWQFELVVFPQWPTLHVYSHGFPSVNQSCLSRKKKTCFSSQLRSDLPPTLQ